MSTLEPVPVPSHVPPHLVIDWDFHHPPGGEEALNSAWKSLHSGPDIVWTPRNGGHWIVTRAEDIEFVQLHHDPFSMRSITLGQKTPLAILPLESDPPQHAAYRLVVMPFLTPKAISLLQERIRNTTIELIESIRPRGECDFVRDFAMQLPIIIFMGLVDLPLADLDRLLSWTEAAVRPRKPDDSRWAFEQLGAYLTEFIAARRASPGKDMVSAIVNARIGDREITDTEMHGMLVNVIFGGLDTVASTMSFAVEYLAQHPEKRHQLINQPDLIANAPDEIVRAFAPSSTGRVVTRDYEYKGVLFKAGDRLYVRALLHGMDERRWENPLEVDFTRRANQQDGFGAGPHKCPGALLARTEIRIFLEEWLKRIPDFSLKPGHRARYSAGMVNCVLSVPLVW